MKEVGLTPGWLARDLARAVERIAEWEGNKDYGQIMRCRCGWRPIAVAPKNGTRILAYDPNAASQLVIFWNASWRVAWTGEVNNDVRYWMPLPAHPEVETTQ